MDLSLWEDQAFDAMFEEEKARSKDSQLISDKVLREKVKLELDAIKDTLAEQVRSGYLSLMKIYHDHNANQPSENKVLIPFLEPGFFNEQIVRQKGIIKLVNFEDNLADYFNIESESFEYCYNLVLTLFDQKRYEEAEQILFFLNFICPASAEFLNAMGHAEYKLHHYDQAASLFLMAFSAEDSDPEPLKYAAYCFNRMGDEESARECLDLADKIKVEAVG